MARLPAVSLARRVALRKESVDRNFFNQFVHIAVAVALRKESVDRNCYAVFCVFLVA